MNTLEYSIVYASIRPEIKERVSVGIIFCQEGVILSRKSALESVANIDYLNRYSNNILTVSEIKKVRMDTENLSKDGLYKMYVYRRTA